MYTLFVLIFLFNNIDCLYLLQQKYETLKFSFLVVKFSECLNRHVFVMLSVIVVCSSSWYYLQAIFYDWLFVDISTTFPLTLNNLLNILFSFIVDISILYSLNN